MKRINGRLYWEKEVQTSVGSRLIQAKEAEPTLTRHTKKAKSRGNTKLVPTFRFKACVSAIRLLALIANRVGQSHSQPTQEQMSSHNCVSANLKKRGRVDADDDINDAQMDLTGSPPKSPKLEELEDLSIHNKEAASLQFPFIIRQDKIYGTSMQVRKRITTINFQMKTCDIKLMKREPVHTTGDEPFKFKPFSQFHVDPVQKEGDYLGTIKKSKKEEFDLAIDSLHEEMDLKVELRKVWSDYYASKLASSVNEMEHQWLESNRILKRDLTIPTWCARVERLILYVDRGELIRFEIDFPDGPVTEHMAWNAMEQVLRQPATPFIKSLIKTVAHADCLNCKDMYKRYKHIINDDQNQNLVIGDMISIDLNGTQTPCLQSDFLFRAIGCYEMWSCPDEQHDVIDLDSDDAVE